MSKIAIYDIEIFPNLFLIVFYELETGEWKIFQISPYKDDRYGLMQYLSTLSLMVGFNNLEFDYPLLHTFIVFMNRDKKMFGKKIVEEIKRKADSIIRSKKRFGNMVMSPAIPQLDLYKMHHFDNVAKATSLKALEFVLRMPEIEVLPFPPNTVLTPDQIQKVIDYCIKDVKTTTALHEKSINQIVLRERLSAIYNLPMMNWNEPKIGEQILLSAIRKKTGKEQLGKTIRDKIVVNDILFPYLSFYSPEFKAIYNWFKSKIMTETKEVFSKLPLDEVESLKPYVNLDRNPAGKKMTMKRDPITKQNTILRTLNIVYNGFQYDFGTGGIHGSIKPSVHVEDEYFGILDVDVQSYYPKLGIENKFYPEHLDAIFCEVYEEIFETRKQYPKGTPENLGLKLGLNGAYGKSNSFYSELYDPQYTMTTTINGQLSLCMLSEMLSFIPESMMLQINTDGLTIKLPRRYMKVAKEICKRWEKITKLNLEYVRYSKMVIRDVNNYLAIERITGKIKRKGIFEYEKELHQNHSMLVIPKALEAYFVNNIPLKQFIMNHSILWDFFKRVKLTGDSKLVLRTVVDMPIQPLTRYYVSREGGTLIKIMPPLKDEFDREFNIEAGYLCSITNNVNNGLFSEMKNNIHYGYYINEANKVIRNIVYGEECEIEEMESNIN
jgi:hypothetical protein